MQYFLIIDSAGPYGGDISPLQLQMWFYVKTSFQFLLILMQSEDTLRFKISDPNNQRWEGTQSHNHRLM